MDYELIIKECIKEKVLDIQLVSETNNKVYKVALENGKVLYAKFYKENSSHIDNELKIYDIVDNKYLKEIYYKSLNPKMAIFEELIGKTVSDLTEEEKERYADKIVSSLCDYFNGISNYKVEGYGLLDSNLNGKFDNFYDFIESRQEETSLVLNEYKELSVLFDLIYKEYKNIISSDNSLVPIDTNLQNIMVMNNGEIKFCDPGEMISGPILMAYGDFVAHTYKTILYEKLIEKLKLNDDEKKLLRIYAIFSSLNILAFLKKHGVNELNTIIPYGNTHTFYEMINEHAKELKLNK